MSRQHVGAAAPGEAPRRSPGDEGDNLGEKDERRPCPEEPGDNHKRLHDAVSAKGTLAPLDEERRVAEYMELAARQRWTGNRAKGRGDPEEDPHECQSGAGASHGRATACSQTGAHLCQSDVTTPWTSTALALAWTSMCPMPMIPRNVVGSWKEIETVTLLP